MSTNNKKRYTVKMETITPKYAKELLGTVQRNRRLSEHRVDKYASDMRAGKWSPATMLILDDNGNLVDANHRLNAVIKSGVPVDMVVFHGLETKYLPFIDTGRPRSAGDMLAFMEEMDGVASLRNKAAIARHVIAFDKNMTGLGLPPVGYDDIANIMIDNKDLFVTSYADQQACRGIGGCCGIGVASYLIRRDSKAPQNEIDQFFLQIAYGENIRKGDAAYAARGAILGNRGTGGSKIKRDMYIVLKAWDAYIRRETCQFIRIPKEVTEKMPAVSAWKR